MENNYEVLSVGSCAESPVEDGMWVLTNCEIRNNNTGNVVVSERYVSRPDDDSGANPAVRHWLEQNGYI